MKSKCDHIWIIPHRATMQRHKRKKFYTVCFWCSRRKLIANIAMWHRLNAANDNR